MRRLPVYLLVDTSGSMRGEPIAALQSGIQHLCSMLMNDPMALETVYLSVITFADSAEQLVPLTELDEFKLPQFDGGGMTNLGEALKLAAQCAEREVVKPSLEAKGDWKPLVLIMIGSKVTDDLAEGIAEFRQQKWGNIVACAAGNNADPAELSLITEKVVTQADSNTLNTFFKWITVTRFNSSLIVSANMEEITSVDVNLDQLSPPPPPPELLPFDDSSDSVSADPVDADPASVEADKEESSHRISFLRCRRRFRLFRDDKIRQRKFFCSLYKDLFMRRLPVYLLVDTSGSMRGEPIAAANNGLQAMIATLKIDPFALESVCISVITFDRDVKEVLPLTELDTLQMPDLVTPESGPTLMGKALEFLMQKLDRDIIKNRPDQKGDWRPLLFVITDGKPSDKALYKEMTEKIKQYKFAAIVACAAGQEAQTDPLKQLTDHVYSLATMDGSSFTQFFKWVSQSIANGTEKGAGASNVILPPPPSEVNIVF